MKVRLMLTCLCDAFYGEVVIAAARVLESAGCEVLFDSDQTCCGQPPFNSGSWDSARTIARHCLRVLDLDKDDPLPVVTPSASCAAMMREGYPLLFDSHTHLPVFELGEFLWNHLNVRSWPNARPTERKIAFHTACHGRAIGLGNVQQNLLASLPGLQIVPFQDADQCCGFGGAFCATHSAVSAGIGDEKLKNVLATGVTELVSGDMGCLMHLQGLIDRQGLDLKTRHYAELLAEAVA